MPTCITTNQSEGQTTHFKKGQKKANIQKSYKPYVVIIRFLFPPRTVSGMVEGGSRLLATIVDECKLVMPMWRRVFIRRKTFKC